jgi:hypothetical protein
MKLKDHNIRLDLSAITRNRYGRARDTMAPLQAAEQAVTDLLGSGGPYLTRDLWSSFYAPESKVDSSTDGSNLHRLADYLLQTVNEAGILADVHDKTQGSTMSSVEACLAAMEVLKEMPLPEPPQEEAQVTMQRDNGDTQVITASDDKVSVSMTTASGSTVTKTVAAKDGESGRSMMDKIIEKQRDKGYRVTEMKSVDEAFDARLGNALDAIEKDQALSARLRQVASDSFAEALEDIASQDAAFVMAYGKDAGKEASRDPSTEDLALVQQLSTPNLRSFIAKIGRFLDAFGSSSIPDKVRGAFAVDGIELTDQVSRLTPTEVAMFTVPGLRAYQTVRLVTRQTFGYRKTQLGTKQSGPFLVSLDTSESMSWPDRDWPTPAAYAAAAALAAAEEGRKVSVVTFSTATHDLQADLETPGGRVAFIKRMMSIRPAHGTDFNGTVDAAAKLDADADVLLISDGDGPLDQDQARSVFASRRLHYLVVGAGSGKNSTLMDLAGERAVSVTSLNDEQAAILAASSIITR